MLYGQLDTVQYRLTQLERRHYAQVPVLSGCCKHGGLYSTLWTVFEHLRSPRIQLTQFDCIVFVGLTQK